MRLSASLGLTDRRNGTSLSSFAVNGVEAQIVFDAASGTYKKNAANTNYSGLFTAGGDSLKTQVNSAGELVWAPHNLALNSATPATQGITVVSGADYTVECTGVSIALSGAGTGTVTEGSPVTITASTTTLTLTVTGSTGTMWAYRSAPTSAAWQTTRIAGIATSPPPPAPSTWPARTTTATTAPHG